MADAPWRVATGADFLYPATQGSRPPGTNRVNAYLARVIRRAAEDEVVNVALTKVQNLLARPESLMHPRIVGRVLAPRRGPRRRPARSRHPRARASSAVGRSGSISGSSHPAAPDAT